MQAVFILVPAVLVNNNITYKIKNYFNTKNIFFKKDFACIIFKIIIMIMPDAEGSRVDNEGAAGNKRKHQFFGAFCCF